MKRAFFLIMYDLDVTANQIIGGKYGQTISARAFDGYMRHQIGWCITMRVIDFLASPFEKDHCWKAYKYWLFRHCKGYDPVTAERFREFKHPLSSISHNRSKTQ